MKQYTMKIVFQTKFTINIRHLWKIFMKFASIDTINIVGGFCVHIENMIMMDT